MLKTPYTLYSNDHSTTYKRAWYSVPENNVILRGYSVNRKKIITIAVCAVLLCTGIIGVLLFADSCRKSSEQRYINEVLDTIASWDNSFNNAVNRSFRVISYVGLTNYYADYKYDGFESERLTLRFNAVISSMEDWFFSLYSNEMYKVENREISDFENLIEIYYERIVEINLFKAMIETDGIFEDYHTRYKQLFEKADTLISLYNESIDRVGKINDANERFFEADREGKVIAFIDYFSMWIEYGAHDPYHDIYVFTKINSALTDAQTWFLSWYLEKIEELSVYTVDFDEIDDADKRFESLIDAMIELNNLYDLYDEEHEVFHISPNAQLIQSKLDEALEGNLSALEKLGLKMIDEMDYHEDAKAATIEYFSDLFEEWKEDHRTNEQLPLFAEKLQKALIFGKEVHDGILEQERRGGSTGGGSGGSDGVLVECIWRDNRCQHPGQWIWNTDDDGNEVPDTRVWGCGVNWILYDLDGNFVSYIIY